MNESVQGKSVVLTLWHLFVLLAVLFAPLTPVAVLCESAAAFAVPKLCMRPILSYHTAQQW